jgi:hypothetical protein
VSGYNQILICAIAILFGVFTFDLLRRRRLNVEYGLLWLILAAGVLGVVGWKWLLFRVTFWMGARQPASILAMLSLAFIFFFLAFLTVQLSTMTSRIKHLTQVVALLEHEVREMKEKQGGTEEKAEESETADGRRET